MRMSDWSSDVCSSDLPRWRPCRPPGSPPSARPDCPGWAGCEATRPVPHEPERARLLGRNRRQSAQPTMPLGGRRPLLLLDQHDQGAEAALRVHEAHRSEERRVGKVGVSTCRPRLPQDNLKEKTYTHSSSHLTTSTKKHNT